MAQITVNLPTMENWKTTLFGIITAIGYALMTYFQTGQITWQGAVSCALWAIFCYLVPDAKNNKDAQSQIEALLEAATAKKAIAVTAPSPGQPAIPTPPAT